MEPHRTAAPCLTRSLIAVSLVQGATEREGRGPNPSLRSALRDRLPLPKWEGETASSLGRDKPCPYDTSQRHLVGGEASASHRRALTCACEGIASSLPWRCTREGAPRNDAAGMRRWLCRPSTELCSA